MGLTLGELLDQPGFGLELRAGGADARARVVRGVHCLELLDPVPWLQEGWIMLTAGAQLRSGAAAQRLLVERVAAGRIAALGFGTGAFMPEVPEALLAEAEQRGFPVFTSPYETPFREIVTYVNQSVLSHDLHVLRRLTWMQQYLSDALREPDAEQQMAQRLSGLLDGAAVGYVDLAGAPIAAAGGSAAWAELAAEADPRAVCEADAGGRWALVAPVHDRATPHGWLIAVARSRPPDRQLARSLLQAAVNLLALLLSTRRSAARSRADRRRRVATSALRVARGGPDPGLAAALAEEGIDFAAPCRLALAAERAPAGERGADALAALDGYARADGLDAVTAPWEGRAALLAQHDLASLEGWLAARAGPPLAVGVSAPLERAAQVGEALAQAELALAAADGADGRRPALRRHEELPPEVLVVGEVRSPAVFEALTAVLAPLAGQQPLLDAMRAYLAADLDVAAAAAALHLHRNSLRNRLRRAEELLGRPLRSPATIAAVQLALIARGVARPTTNERQG